MKNAIRDAYATYHSIHADATGAKAVAVMSETIVTGHVDIWGDEPKRAAIITGINAVYNQISIGRPASWAYAIDWGMSIKETLKPAIISLFSILGSFRSLIQWRKGNILYK